MFTVCVCETYRVVMSVVLHVSRSTFKSAEVVLEHRRQMKFRGNTAQLKETFSNPKIILGDPPSLFTINGFLSLCICHSVALCIHLLISY